MLTIPAESTTHNYEFCVYQGEECTYKTTLPSNPDTVVWARGYGSIWYTKYRYELFQDDVLVQEEIFNLEKRNVLITFRSNALGDNLAWMPYVMEFQKKHRCNLTVETIYHSLFQRILPDISFLSNRPQKDFYFQYSLGVFEKENEHPINWRYIPLQQVASDMLGLAFEEKRLNLVPLAKKRNIEGKYVCIAPRSTMRCKEWNWQLNRGQEAWQSVVDWLVEEGYQVIWISSEECFLNNVINRAGKYPLEDRITDLTHAEFYIGLPSGLSWLANTCNIHVFMITGFSRNWYEFQENITRIYKEDVCRGCFNENFPFTREWAWCPQGKQFQCTRLISPEDVIKAIQKWLLVGIENISNKQMPSFHNFTLEKSLKEKVKNIWSQI